MKKNSFALKIGYIGLLLGVILSAISFALVISTLSEESIYYLMIPFWPLFLFVSDILEPIIQPMFNIFADMFPVPKNLKGLDSYDLFLSVIYYVLSIFFYFMIFYGIGILIEKIKKEEIKRKFQNLISIIKKVIYIKPTKRKNIVK